MLHKPHSYEPLLKAHVIVGCSTETALKVFFNKNDFLKEAVDFAYVGFFDENGVKFNEVQVVDWQEGFNGLHFQDEY